MKRTLCTVCCVLFVVGLVSAHAQTAPRVGVRAGIGTDVTGGIAYGLGVNYLLTFESNPNNSLELGVVFFGGSFEETSEEYHTYVENTDVVVFGVLANYLIGYQPGKAGFFFIAGAGLASIGVEWEERSETDISLGTPLPGGGSMQSADGTSGGSVVNLGVGKTFKGGLDVRLEIPVILAFSSPGEAASVVPTAILTAGIRF